MPGITPESHPGRLTSDKAREIAKRRWRHDPQGLAAAVDKIVERSAALTGDQRSRLALVPWVVLADPEGNEFCLEG